MPEHTQPQPNVPPDCFKQSEVEAFQLLENQTLEAINYYVWLVSPNVEHHFSSIQADPGFLYAIELYFGHGETLLLSSGENSDAIGLVSAESLVGTAQKLREMHGGALIQRIQANDQPIWAGTVGRALKGIRLSRHESGLYSNDVLLLDFGTKRILVQLSLREGLELGEYAL